MIFKHSGGTSRVAINAFNVTKIYSLGAHCTIFLTAGTWESVEGTLEEVTEKLNGFTPSAK